MIDELTATNARYYASMVGSWQAAFAVEVTDRAALRASPVSAMDRLALIAGAWATRWVGPLWIQTTVAIEPDGVVLHTTRVSKAGLTLFRSVERIALDANGSDGRLYGEQRVAPWWAWPVPQEGSVRVHDDAQSATYELPFAGDRVAQETWVEGTALALTQTAAWWRAEARLERISP